MQDALKNDPPTGKENRQAVLSDASRCVTSIGPNEKRMNLSKEGQQLKLVTFRLDEGADPNDVAPRTLSTGNMTAWEAFLGLAIMALDGAVFEYTEDLHMSEFRDVLKCFVVHGADPHQEFVYPLSS